MTRQDFANRWGFQPAKGYGSALFDCRESLLKDLDAVIANEVKNLDLPHVMPSLPDDAVRSNEQNLRMREWFKERTGLEDALLSEHMEVIDKMLKGNGA